MNAFQLLIVDDDVDFAESMAEMLAEQGYAVSVANSGSEGLTHTRQNTFDLVLLDMKMPGMSGLECLRLLRQERPGIRVVMVTAFTQGEFLRQALQEGALAVLGKSYSPELLLETIAHLISTSMVLLVEDDQDQAEAITQLLRNNNYTVQVAKTLAEAKYILTLGSVDLLLLDFCLPDGTGAELLNWIQASGKQIATILITGYEESALAALPLVSLDTLLVKPFNPKELLNLLSQYKSHPATAP
ncbi:MAG: response regulator [Deltaproteobacteria bacterium]|nr:response regulator [Deltaproteobacteria bacterium]